jgi:hypothetical protein
MRDRIKNRHPVGIAEAAAVRLVDHRQAFGENTVVAEHLADLTGSDEIAQLVKPVLDAFDGVGQILDRRLERQPDGRRLELNDVGT